MSSASRLATKKSEVTVILPTRNRAKLLARSIESILSQSHERIQLLVLDNASTDNTCEIAQSYCLADERVRYIRHDKNLGAALNFRFGISAVSTDYFCIISDDDFMLPTFIEDGLSVLDCKQEIGFVCMDTLYVDEDYKILSSPTCDGKLSIKSEPNRIFFHRVPMTWTSMIFKKSIKDIFLRIDVLSDPGFDISMLRLAAAYYPYAYYSKIGACFTCHPGSFSTVGFPVEDMLNYYIISLARLASISLNAGVNSMIRDESSKEAARLLKKGFYSYMLPSLIDSLKQFVVYGSETDYNRFVEMVNMLARFGSPLLIAFLKFAIRVSPCLAVVRPMLLALSKKMRNAASQSESSAGERSIHCYFPGIASLIEKAEIKYLKYGHLNA